MRDDPCSDWRHPGSLIEHVDHLGRIGRVGCSAPLDFATVDLRGVSGIERARGRRVGTHSRGRHEDDRASIGPKDVESIDDVRQILMPLAFDSGHGGQQKNMQAIESGWQRIATECMQLATADLLLLTSTKALATDRGVTVA